MSFKGKKHTTEYKKNMSIWRKNYPVSDGTRKKQSENKKEINAWKGNSNPNWKGGIHSFNRMARHNGEYIHWRREVLRTKGNVCLICKRELGKRCNCCGQKIMRFVHHKKSFEEFPELRYEVSNGIVLCQACHDTVENLANSVKPRTGNAELNLEKSNKCVETIYEKP